jgi:hypothetical protein
MRGAVSKHNSFFVGAYDAVYKVLFKNGNVHCFEHMFEINRQALMSSHTAETGLPRWGGEHTRKSHRRDRLPG